MSLPNVPVKEQTAGVTTTADAAAEERMFRRPSEWRIFWEAFSQDRLALGAAALIGARLPGLPARAGAQPLRSDRG